MPRAARATQRPRRAAGRQRLPELEPRIGAPTRAAPPPQERERTPRQEKAEAELASIAAQLRRALQAPTQPPEPGPHNREILPEMLRALNRAQRAVGRVLTANNAEIRRLRQQEEEAPAKSVEADDALRQSCVLQLMTPGIRAWQNELKQRAKATLLEGLQEALSEINREHPKNKSGRPPTGIKQSHKLSAMLDWSHPATLLQLELAQAKMAPQPESWRVAYRAPAMPAQKEENPQARAAA